PCVAVELRVHPANEPPVDRAADDRRGPERRERVPGDAREAPPDDLLHPARDRYDALREPDAADAREPAGVLRQRPHDLHHEERDALGLSLEKRHQLGAPREGADCRVDERSGRLSVEALEPEDVDARKALGKTRRLVVAIAPDQDDRQPSDGTREPAEDLEAL